MKNPVVASIASFASRLRFPGLFALSASILVLDLLIPDVIPFVDEILLSLVTLALSSFRKPREDRRGTTRTAEPGVEAGPVIDVEPAPGPAGPRDDS